MMMKKSVFMLMLTAVLLTAGCGTVTEHKSTPDYDDYMSSVKEQSNRIKQFLEQDALTQADMNAKSKQLHELWDEAMNVLWSELKTHLPEEEFAVLQDEQRVWMAEREKRVKEAGEKYAGGSVYPLIVNGEAAAMTEERVYRLYELLEGK